MLETSVWNRPNGVGMGLWVYVVYSGFAVGFVLIAWSYPKGPSSYLVDTQAPKQGYGNACKAQVYTTDLLGPSGYCLKSILGAPALSDVLPYSASWL